MVSWADIHEDFSKIPYADGETYQQKWEEASLTYQEAQEWIVLSFKPDNYDKVKQWKNHGFNSQEAKSWLENGLSKEDAEFVAYLRGKGYQPNPNLNLKQLRAEFNTWLEQNKPAPEYLDIIFPKEQRNTITKLDISEKNLTNSLDLTDFINLENLDCSKSQLTQLILPSRANLQRLDCRNNLLTNLDFINNLNQKKMTNLLLSINNFPPQDLSIFREFIQLKGLGLGTGYRDKEKIQPGIYNRFWGSLESLQDSRKLEWLDISNTDINSGLEYLSENIKWFYCSAKARSEAKCQVIYDLLTSEKTEGQNLALRLKAFKNWTSGNQEVDEFIKKWQLKATNYKEVLEWITYEQFKIEKDEQGNNKVLGEGGFGKVYKAEWDDKKDNKRKLVALKSLNNSVDIKANFLQEIANHKLFSSSNRIVNCYGISQDPQTKEYLMIMDYIKDGDLRQFLKDNRLDLESKIVQLWRIAEGLKAIHKLGLTHRDFHSGNILNKKTSKKDVQCYITDLGLCKPANETSQEDKVFGVLPYVAPELLSKKESESIPYTQAADIYSFGIIAYEILSSLPPYYDLSHDPALGAQICTGLRPQFQIKTPPLLEDLINRCWNNDPNQRLTAAELEKTLRKWKNGDNEFKTQLQAAEEYNQTLPEEIRFPKYKIHSGAVYTSRLLPTGEITNLLQGSPATSEQFYTATQFLSLDLISSSTENTEQELINRTKRQLSLDSQAKTTQGETKILKITEDQEWQAEPITIEVVPSWTALHPSFIPQLIQAWQNHNFTYQQAKDWINIHSPTDQNQAAQEPEFYAWLRDIKQVDSDWVLNHGNHQTLKQEYQASQQIAQILQPTNPYFNQGGNQLMKGDHN